MHFALSEIAAILGHPVQKFDTLHKKGLLLHQIKKYAEELTEEDFDPNQNFTQQYHGLSPKTVKVLKAFDLPVPSSWEVTQGRSRTLPEDVCEHRTYHGKVPPYSFSQTSSLAFSIFPVLLWERLGCPTEVEYFSFLEAAKRIASRNPYKRVISSGRMGTSVKRFFAIMQYLHKIKCVHCGQEIATIEKVHNGTVGPNAVVCAEQAKKIMERKKEDPNSRLKKARWSVWRKKRYAEKKALEELNRLKAEGKI